MAHRAEALERQKRNDKARQEAKRAYGKRFKEEHREQLRAYNAEYQPRWHSKNPDKSSTYCKTWRNRHPERRYAYTSTYYAEHKDEIRANINAWVAAHPGGRAAASYRYRARKYNAEICDLTAAQWHAIKEAFDSRCAYCGMQHANLTQDHVVPLSKGGNHTASNIVPACRSCNSRKRDKPMAPPNWPMG